MKRIALYFLAISLLAGAFMLTAPQVQAVNAHVHCVCGGHAEGVGDHVCDQ